MDVSDPGHGSFVGNLSLHGSDEDTAGLNGIQVPLVMMSCTYA